MTFAAVPLGFQPPLTVAVCSIKLRLDQSQQSHGQQWHLIGPQDRFLGPSPALFHAEALFVIAEAPSKTSRMGLFDSASACRNNSGAHSVFLRNVSPAGNWLLRKYSRDECGK